MARTNENCSAVFEPCPWGRSSDGSNFKEVKNSPLPSSRNPHFQNEAKCTIILAKSLICMRLKNHFHILLTYNPKHCWSRRGQNKERKADQNYKTILLHSAQFTTYWATKEITTTTKLSLNYYISHFKTCVTTSHHPDLKVSPQQPWNTTDPANPPSKFYTWTLTKF